MILPEFGNNSGWSDLRLSKVCDKTLHERALTTIQLNS